MCEVLRVSPSGYYDSLDREPSKRAQRHERIKQSVQQVYTKSNSPCIRERCGSAKIADRLQQSGELERFAVTRVATAMRELGIESRVSKSFTPTTTMADPSKQTAENKLDRDFTAEAPNRKCVTDITYLPTATGWVYLAVVLDLFGRKVVGWSMGHSLGTRRWQLSWSATHCAVPLKVAVPMARSCPICLLHKRHSDRDCQYTRDAYQKTLRTLGIECSMIRTGNCYDNAVMERFFWSLRHEWTKHESFDNLEETRLSVFKYIKTFYNRVRIHQSLGDKTPDQYETEYAPVVAA